MDAGNFDVNANSGRGLSEKTRKVSGRKEFYFEETAVSALFGSMKKIPAIMITINLLISPYAFSWGDLGHATVGYLAEKNLTPGARKIVHDILGVEPLSYSAVFPDHVRSDERFNDFALYHFLEIPPGQAFSPARSARKNAHVIIDQVPSLLLSPYINRDQKMILLRYLVHVVGDVQQPLHVGNGVDMGANLCQVRWREPESGQLRDRNLHSVWDESIIANIADVYRQESAATGGKAWFGYKEFGNRLLKMFAGEITYANAQTASVVDWYQQARDLHGVVYPDAAEVRDPRDRTYCRVVNATTGAVEDGKFDPATIPTLSAEYIQRSIPIVSRQVLLGGYRLAGLLNKLAVTGSAPDLDPQLQTALVKDILLEIHCD
jgi:hypothetical protein